MHRCCFVDICHLGVCSYIEPHRQILGQPFGVIFGFFGGIIVQHQISACQSSAVLHAPIVQHSIERSMPLPYRKATDQSAPSISAFGKRIAQTDIGILLHQCHLLCQTALITPIVITIAKGDIFAPCRLNATAIVSPPTDIFGRGYQCYSVGILVCKTFAYP